MLTRIRPAAALDLARRDLPAPVDVINLITTKRFDRYRWYGLFVFPALLAVGARVKWMGRFERSVCGAQQADKLLIVRYPSHRRFLAMTLNPYYLAINRLREAGVSRFEASFTHASHADPNLAAQRQLVAVHFNSPQRQEALPAIRDAVGPVAGECVYATRAVASLGILEPRIETDPSPLTYGELALFACGAEVSDDRLRELGPRLSELTAGYSLQVYRSEPASAYRPSWRAPSRAAEAPAT